MIKTAVAKNKAIGVCRETDFILVIIDSVINRFPLSDRLTCHEVQNIIDEKSDYKNVLGLNNFVNPFWKAFYAFKLMYWTGIRLGELLALNVGDIQDGKLHITKSLRRANNQDIITQPKTESSNRIIALPQFIVNDMEEYKSRLYGKTKNDKLFEVSKGYLEKEIKRGAKMACLKEIRVHDLRHSHASLLIANGVDIATIANRLGHESIKTTLNTYAHLFDENARAVADKLDEIYIGNLEED